MKKVSSKNNQPSVNMIFMRITILLYTGKYLPPFYFIFHLRLMGKFKIILDNCVNEKEYVFLTVSGQIEETVCIKV